MLFQVQVDKPRKGYWPEKEGKDGPEEKPRKSYWPEKGQGKETETTGRNWPEKGQKEIRPSGRNWPETAQKGRNLPEASPKNRRDREEESQPTERSRPAPDFSKDAMLLPGYEPTRGFDAEQFVLGIPEALARPAGQEKFCDGMQDRINACYRQFGIAPLELTDGMRAEISMRMADLGPMNIEKSPKSAAGISVPKFLDIAGVFFDRYGLLSALPVSGLFFYTLFSDRASFSKRTITVPAAAGIEKSLVEHELLHAASGVPKPSANPLKILADTLLAPFRLVSDAISALKPLGSHSFAKIPFLTLGEIMTSLVTGENQQVFLGERGGMVEKKRESYAQFVGPVRHALMQMGQKERKEMLDALIITWLNFADEATKKKAEDFISGRVK